MPQGGSNPGQRRGGRKKGTLDKKTLAKGVPAMLTMTAEEAEQILSKHGGRTTPKEVLWNLMILTYEMMEQAKDKEPEKFWRCMQTSIDCAYKLARYVHPTYASVEFSAAPDTNERKRFTLTIFDQTRQIEHKVDDAEFEEISDGNGIDNNFADVDVTSGDNSNNDGEDDDGIIK